MCARRFFFAAVLAVVGVLAAPPTSEAAFLLRLESGGQVANINLDTLASGTGGSGGNYDYTFFFREQVQGTTTGTFTNLEFAGYTISSAVNITNQPGTPLGGNLSLNGLTVSRNAGSEDDLTISLTATGYNLPGVQDTLDSNFAARLNSLAEFTPVIDFRSTFAVGDTPFAPGIDNLATTEGSNFGPRAPQEPFGVSRVTDLGATTSSYTLTNVVSITGLGFGVSNRLDQGGASTLVTPSNTLQAVPAPAGLILVAGAVPFLALLRRRFRKTDPTPEAATAV